MTIEDQLRTKIERYKQECEEGIRVADTAAQALSKLPLDAIPEKATVFFMRPFGGEQHCLYVRLFDTGTAYDLATEMARRTGLVFRRELDVYLGDIMYISEVDGIRLQIMSRSDPTCKIVRRELDRKEARYQLECPNSPAEVPA